MKLFADRRLGSLYPFTPPDREDLVPLRSAPKPLNLIIPGLDGSGARHWQTLWEQTRDDCERVQLGDWSQPEPSRWTERLESAVRRHAAECIVLVAHSLGCLLVSHWAARHPLTARTVSGALLVAPCDPNGPADPRTSCFAGSPPSALPFPVIVAVSRNDRFADIRWSTSFAELSGGEFVDVGEQGHINADSDLGVWPLGQQLLARLLR